MGNFNIKMGQQINKRRKINMIDVTTKVPVKELNLESFPTDKKVYITVRSHFLYQECVVLEVEGKTYTVNTAELVKGIGNTVRGA